MPDPEKGIHQPYGGGATYIASEGSTVTFNAPVYGWMSHEFSNLRLSNGEILFDGNESDGAAQEFADGGGYLDIQSVALKANTYYYFYIEHVYDTGYKWDFFLHIYVVDGETAAQILQTTPTAPSDTPSAWAVSEVNAAIEAGLVPENLQKNYQQDVTREAIATLFINVIEKASGKSIEEVMAEKGVEINPNAYSDTNDPLILAADALGILRGKGDGKFDPDGNLLRSHIATVVGRVARTLGVDTEGYTHSFADLVGHWAESEVGWAVHMNIIRGVSETEFNPEGNLTTEQLIAMANRTLEALSN
ncbi:S-layer homology domain-containing protein [Oscillospiraceae bacterium OttesenSCG-928-G22]|nr:S-layer homology domain-containing protein [Oscillospiraceae bacterium OttesenSCG-928-G22]